MSGSNFKPKLDFAHIEGGVYVVGIPASTFLNKRCHIYALCYYYWVDISVTNGPIKRRSRPKEGQKFKLILPSKLKFHLTSFVASHLYLK